MDSNARRRPDRNAANAYHEDEVTVLTGPKNAGIGRSNHLVSYSMPHGIDFDLIDSFDNSILL